jgi:hypothetical protein
MKSSSKIKPLHRDLIRRYLIWAYKSTKESFDRLERKTTQLMADEYILSRLAKSPRRQPDIEPQYSKLVGEFKEYIARKKSQPIDAAQHAYLRDRLNAVEVAIKDFLGAKELHQIHAAYEAEFTRRIWESKDH